LFTRIKNYIRMIRFDKRKNQLIKMGLIAIDKNAVILPSVNFDFREIVEMNRNTKVNISEYSVIGCDFIFETKDGYISIGKRTFINSGTSIISRNEIVIGDDVTIAWNCTLYDHNAHSIDWRERKKDLLDLFKYGQSNYMKHKNWSVVKSRPIVIKDKVWIGFGCTILNGVTIGEGAIIGANSVVREDVKPWTIVAGNPAKEIRSISHE